MKKLLSIIFTLLICSTTVLADSLNANQKDNKLALSKKAAPIEDELIQSDVFPKILPEYIRENTPITDDIIVPYASEGMTIRLWAIKSSTRKKVTIDDELITPKLMAKVGNISVLKKCQKTKIEDNLAKNHLSMKGHRKIHPKTDYDFTKAQIPVQLKIIKNLTTKHHILEGDSILFKTIKEVSLNDGTILPKGTEVIGRVETISDSDKMGTPANIVVDNFYVKDHPEISLYGNVSKTGANRSIWVYPLYQAGNLMFYVAGFVFVPIHGGHAKLLTSDTYTVFYETH